MMGYDYCRVRDINLQMGKLWKAELNCAIQTVICTVPSDLVDFRLDAGPLIQYLQKVKSWLDANSDEGSCTVSGVDG
jgi:hypothetical protein